MFRLASLLVVLLLTAPQALAQSTAATFIGPGNVAITAGDGSHDLIAVDLTNFAVLAPGNHYAFDFRYQFSTYKGFQTSGTVTPLLLAFDGTNLIPIAIGEPVRYTSPTEFISAPFGGSARFRLNDYSVVFAALYWTAAPGPEVRMPVGYRGDGLALVFYQDARRPVLGVPISGDSVGVFDRTYNFAIEVLN